MEAKTHHTAVVLIPPQSCGEPIQAIRRRYDRHFHRWMPHVTLIYPFRPRERFDEVEGPLRDAGRRIEPFEITLAEFRHFHHGRARYTLWLAPDPKDAMVKLQAAMEAAVPDCHDVSAYRDGFTPHLSVGQVQGHDAMKELQAGLQRSWQPLTFVAESVSLIWRSQPPDDIFRVDRNISFGK